MSDRIDRLYDLLPVVYRQRDVELGHPLRDLLRVIAEQVNLLEDDIAQMYENWFIETCEEWAVPYIGDLLGYSAVPAAGAPGDPATAEGRARNEVLTPRREVANLIRNRRRRGTLALLELLAGDTSGLPARAVEAFPLLGWTQALNHLNLDRARTADLRDVDALDRISTPFDSLARCVDVRRPISRRTPSRWNIPAAAAFVWRLRAYPVNAAPAAYLQKGGGHLFYAFNVLGYNSPLFINAVREPDPTAIAGELNVPIRIRRRALEDHLDDYYGFDADGQAKSFVIWVDDRTNPLPKERIVVADLSDWFYRPQAGTVAVDPKLGRFIFHLDDAPKEGVWVSYRYGFSMDIGGGEYARRLRQAADAVIYRVGEGERFTSIVNALQQWEKDGHRSGVIEIADNNVYQEDLSATVGAKKDLQIRAANGVRPTINLPDSHRSLGEWLRFTVEDGARVTLDGLLISGRPLRIDSGSKATVDARLSIRDCTLVPGWGLDHDCNPTDPAEQSLEIFNVRGRVSIDRSILGSITVNDTVIGGEPVRLEMRDSILDATSNEREALSGPGPGYAYAVLEMARCTVFGTVSVHSIELAENSIFNATLRVARRQTGCVRFCWVPPPDSRTPRRYHCQPDLLIDEVKQEGGDDESIAAVELYVAPRFNSVRYGHPDYAQLAYECAVEIFTGADDETEMGAFHDTFEAQRNINLRARLDEYTPAGMETGIFYAD